MAVEDREEVMAGLGGTDEHWRARLLMLSMPPLQTLKPPPPPPPLPRKVLSLASRDSVRGRKRDLEEDEEDSGDGDGEGQGERDGEMKEEGEGEREGWSAAVTHTWCREQGLVEHGLLSLSDVRLTCDEISLPPPPPPPTLLRPG